MFKAIKNWWNGLWAKEESPGPKITREDIAKVEEAVKEIRSGTFDRAKPTSTTAECMAKATGAEYGRKYVNQGGQAAPVRPPKPKPIPRKGDSLTVHFAEHPVERGLGVSADVTTVERNGCVAKIDANGHLMPVGMDHVGHMPPNPTGKTILPAMEMSFIAEAGIQPARKEGGLVQMLGETGWPYHDEPVVGKIEVGHRTLEETVAERLANPQIIKVGIEDLDGDTALPTPRKPRRRGKRGGVKRNRRNKNK